MSYRNFVPPDSKLMETTNVLVFVGTEGIYHDHVSHGKFLSELLSGANGMEAFFAGL